jgi:hypothetical protein
MAPELLEFFRDIDASLGDRFEAVRFELRIFGYTALALAGLPQRGTKDIDALSTGVLADRKQTDIADFLRAEFGKRSPGGVRHGVYLDLVAESVPWLPPRPHFIPVQTFTRFDVLRLHPVDTCVSKTFSNFMRQKDRASDRKDILDTLDHRIIAFADYKRRLDETFSRYETHAEAPEVFPRVMQWMSDTMIPNYGDASCRLRYELPSWMENM